MANPLELITRALAGRYAVERQLGEGGWATVYLALDERHRRMVAVKVLKPELTRTLGVERFGREIEIAARLNHPHILPLLDSGTIELERGWPATAYYVMPYVPGESLRHRLEREGKLPVAEALRIAREVADALDYAHRQGVIHRDIKPENILISETHAVVADFGIARALDEAGAGGGAGITGVGQPLGTPAYMSPEQVTAEQAIDGRTDLYALACTLYEMLSGQPPWTGGTLSSLLARRLAQPAPRIRTIAPSVPQPVDDALARALSTDPAQRFATPAEFAAVLDQGVARARPGGARRTALRVLAGVGAALALVLITTRLARSGRADAITSIAIAPQQADSAIQYLSDGIQEGVADLLRRLPQLRVTAPSLVGQVRGQQPGLNDVELGKALKVAAVLTWQLRQEDDSLHVRAELLQIPSGDLRWSFRHARPIAEVAAIQGEIARMIADSLRLQATGVERTLDWRSTTSAAAYSSYLRGRKFLTLATPLGARGGQAMNDSVLHYAEEAIARDSNFAAAYALRSTYYFLSAYRGWKSPLAAYADSAAVAASRALALDSTLGDPWVNRFAQAMYLDDDWAAALEIADAASRLAGYDEAVLQFLAIVAGEVEGDLDSALTLIRQSVEIEPGTANLNTQGDLYLRARRNDSAIAVLRRAIVFDPSVPGPRRRLILGLERSGRYAEAVAERRAMGEKGAEEFARGYAAGGARGYQQVLAQDARERIDSLTRAMSDPFTLPRDTIPPTREARIATLYAQLGEWTSAMDWIIRERQRRPKRFRLYLTNPEFAGIRADPRFAALVREDGLQALANRKR